MNVKELFRDDDAVSPVIGVILMVAITVILAAVIGAFVLNIGGSQESAPQVTWEFADNPAGDNVTIKHGGGDKVTNPSQIEAKDGGSPIDTLDNIIGDPITAGDEGDASVSAGTTGTLELVWTSSDSSDSQILATHEYDTN